MAYTNNVIICDNWIRYYGETLKVSNISRTWIFKFQNIEKRKFEEQMLAYRNSKTQYEEMETLKKKKSVRNNIIGAGILFLCSSLLFAFEFGAFGFLSLCVTGLLAYVAYKVYKQEIIYPYQPPKERIFPDKFGLGIEMNSGHKVTFTAIGDDGVNALRKLQNDIEEADIHKGIVYFNMGDYNITVENNDGIISTGDFANNICQKGGQGDL